MVENSRRPDEPSVVGTTVVVADESPMVAAGLARLVEEGAGGLEVVATVADPDDLISTTLHHAPDVLVVDPELLDDASRLSDIVTGSPATRVLLVPRPMERDALGGLLLAGAVAYVPKDLGAEAIVAGVVAVARGLSVVSDRYTRVMARLSAGLLDERYARLTEDERRLLRLVARGGTYEQIAAELHVSPRTARRHVAALLRTLGVEDRIQAAELAGRLHLLDGLGPRMRGGA